MKYVHLPETHGTMCITAKQLMVHLKGRQHGLVLKVGEGATPHKHRTIQIGRILLLSYMEVGLHRMKNWVGVLQLVNETAER